MLASFLDLEILSCDIGNAYINAPCREKIWCVAGPEFGPEDEGSVLIIERALYGLKSSGAAWRAMLAQTMRDLGYKSCLADPDVWIRPQSKPDGSEYYEYCLIYVDDILCVSHEPGKTMSSLAKLYRLKEDPAPPQRYLGANILRHQLVDGRVVWAMSSYDYVKNAVRIVEDLLDKDGERGLSPRGMKVPWSNDYRPELDISRLLTGDMIT
jgi:hypothetical protein